MSLLAVITNIPAPCTWFHQSLDVVVILYFGFDVCCTKSGMTVTYNQRLMIFSVRSLTTLPLCRVTFACEGLSFNYYWNSKVIFRVRFVETGVTEMRFVGNFRHLAFTFHTSNSDSIGTAVILSRL